jgi:hypothetical protein
VARLKRKTPEKNLSTPPPLNRAKFSYLWTLPNGPSSATSLRRRRICSREYRVARQDDATANDTAQSLCRIFRRLGVEQSRRERVPAADPVDDVSDFVG